MPLETLYGLDVVLNDAYQKKISNLGAEAALSFRKEQKAWIKTRDRCQNNLPTDADWCLYARYEDRLISLGAIDELLSFYRKGCERDDWKCFSLGQLEIKFSRWSEAVKDLTGLCNADYDGDAGESCFLKATALEHLGKKSEAVVLAKKACDTRQNNKACAMAHGISKDKLLAAV